MKRSKAKSSPTPPGLNDPALIDSRCDRRPEYVRRREAARFLGLAPRTLANWACIPGRGPSFHRVGRTVLYDMGELRAFVAAGRIEMDKRA